MCPAVTLMIVDRFRLFLTRAPNLTCGVVRLGWSRLTMSLVLVRHLGLGRRFVVLWVLCTDLMIVMVICCLPVWLFRGVLLRSLLMLRVLCLVRWVNWRGWCCLTVPRLLLSGLMFGPACRLVVRLVTYRASVMCRSLLCRLVVHNRPLCKWVFLIHRVTWMTRWVSLFELTVRYLRRRLTGTPALNLMSDGLRLICTSC